MMNAFVAVLVTAACAFAVQEEVNWKIIGGKTASIGQFPYIISLQYMNNHICGGSIIASIAVLTAAHCLIEKNQNLLTVMAGSNQRNVGTTETNSVVGTQHGTVKRILVHGLFYPGLFFHDIALLFLDNELKFNAKVYPVVLGTEFVERNVHCVLSGWGSSREPNGTMPNNLQYITLKTLGHKECLQKRHPFSPAITVNQLCTFTIRGQGACTGDSGGPLVANRKLIGIVSWGVPCAQGYPDVFTRVSVYINWIRNSLSLYPFPL